jgi:hypothetical protein
MRFLSPGKMIFIGFIMVIVGFILPMLMVIQVLKASFLLIFIAYAVSAGGLLLGFVGASFIVMANRPRNRDREYDHDYDRDHDHYE